MTDLDQIRAQVNERRARAAELGLVKTVFWLWDRHINAFQHPDYRNLFLPTIVKTCVWSKTDESWRTPRRCLLAFEDRTLTFEFIPRHLAMPDGESIEKATLSVSEQDHLVFELDCEAHSDRYVGTVWEPRSVEAFIEGAWILDVNLLADAIKQIELRVAEENKRKKEQEEIDASKRKFGL